MKTVVCEAPVNIAVIKYWGKRDEDLIIPLNDSISVTLSMDHLRARTSITMNPASSAVEFSLNGKEEKLSKRFTRVLELCRQEAFRQHSVSPEEVSAGLQIVSENNFPTAAGLASSAAGFACLVYTLKTLYGIQGDISHIVRQGSGSACRSVFGGFVRWISGSGDDGSDSIARQIRPAWHWSALRVLILVVNDQKKDTSSTTGMQTSVETSELLKFHSERTAPKRCEEMTEAINERDFDRFANLTMKDSNRLHAICMDTFPPVFYLTSVSHAIIGLVHSYNLHKEKTVVAYTFDAGPNAFLFTLEHDLPEVMGMILDRFPSVNSNFFRGSTETLPVSPIPVNFPENKKTTSIPDGIQYVIITQPGDEPRVVSVHVS